MASIIFSELTKKNTHLASFNFGDIANDTANKML